MAQAVRQQKASGYELGEESYLPNERVLVRVVDDEAVILDLESGLYYGLNGVATRLWQLLSEGLSSDSAREAIEQEYEVDSDTLRADVDELISDFVAKGLLAALAEESPAKTTP